MYQTRYEDGDWIVINPDGELVGCYDTEEQAKEVELSLNNKEYAN